MTTTLTLARLHDLRLSGMAQALTQQQEQSSTYEALPFLERLGLLVEQECLVRDQRKQDRLIRQARFKLRATVQDIDYQHPRNLQPAQIARLAQGDWVQRAQNLLITGPCGSGKTYLACALGHNACLARVYDPLLPPVAPAALHSPRPRLTAAIINCWLRPLKSGYCSSMIGA